MAYNAPGTTVVNDGPPAWTPPNRTLARPPGSTTQTVSDTPPGGQTLTQNQQNSLAAGKILPAPKPVFKPYEPPKPTPWGGNRAGSDGDGSWVGLSQRPVYPRNQNVQPGTGTIWGNGSFNERAQQAADVQGAKQYMNRGVQDNPQFQQFFDQLNSANVQQQQQQQYGSPQPPVGAYPSPGAYSGGIGSSYNSGGGK